MDIGGFIWNKRLSLVLLLLSLLSPLTFSDVVLEDQEWEELNMIWIELEELLDEQIIQLELAEMQLTIASEAIKELKQSLSEAKQSLSEQEKEQTKKKIIWTGISLLAGFFAGVIVE